MITAPLKRAELVKKLETALAHVFQDQSLLELALTHSSYANEEHDGAAHNERLEFLGDAVLELCVSHVLFHRYSTSREGALTKYRASLVSTTSLAKLARELGLDQLLRLGKGEEQQGGRQRDSVLSDAFEAVL
ncbi:MAG: ribonuclease III, partial [Desulfovibrio sp.]|nr:ribonuclease III [Desulfovibrio sp.]